MLEVLDSDDVKFARAKGLSEGKVIFKHALRNAVNPMITLLGFEFSGLLSGAALTEYAQGTGDWDAVKTAFVDGWATEYAAANGQ